VKRRDLIRHLRSHGCDILREGGKHTVFVNRAKRLSTTIPRHREMNDYLAQKICKDLGVPRPNG